MKKIGFICMLVLFLASCSKPTVIAIDGEGVVIENRKHEEGKIRYTVIFTTVDGKTLDPGPNVAGIHASYSVAGGTREIIVELNVTHRVGIEKVVYRSYYGFRLELEDQHIYTGEARIDGNMAELWIVDKTEGIVVTPKVTGKLKKVPLGIYLPAVIN